MKLRPSELICFREDPELYAAKWIDNEVEETESQDFGTMAHAVILEPHKIDKDYVILPDKTEKNALTVEILKAVLKEHHLPISGTKDALIARCQDDGLIEKQYDQFKEEAESSGKKIITPSENKRLRRIKDKVMNGPLGALLALCEKEVRHEAEIDGATFSFQPDASCVVKGAGICIDVKVTKDWDEDKFERTHFKVGRHIQTATYLDGLTKVKGVPFNSFIWIAIEPTPPHRVRYYSADLGLIEAGRTERAEYLKEFLDRKARNDWSPREKHKRINDTTFPHWDWEKIKGAM